MKTSLKINIPESKAYLLIIGILSITLLYFNLYIGSAALLLLLYLIYYNHKIISKRNLQWVEYIETLSMDMDKTAKQTLIDFPLPLCILNNTGNLTWYNGKFSKLVKQNDMIEKPIDEVVPSIMLDNFTKSDTTNMQTHTQIGNKIFDIKYNIIENENNEKSFALYFFDVTEFNELKTAYEMEKPVIINLQVDSFDEVLDSASEDVRPIIEAEVERTIKLWVNKHSGAFRKITKDKYLAFMDEKALRDLEADKFSILDEIRKIDHGNSLPLTLSIGAASMASDLSSTYKNSITSLDLALGRGGDQAVIRRDERSIFYGGRSKAVEKKTRVKARIIAHALRDLINESEAVIIMGHHNPDLDSIGSAIGMYGICKMLSKKAHIVLDHPNSSIDVLYDRLKANDNFKSVFMAKEEALRVMTPSTLLIVVDTHRPSFTEHPALLDISERIVLIDHHRRGVEFIDKAVLVYHETYASSASEMVTELIQYVKDRPYIDTLIAESLLSGITLDTKNFTFKTGVRTFEAAAFLRKFGADTIAVKQLFQGDLDSFLVKAEGIKNAKILGGSIAITSCPENLENPSLIAAQIADELLNIRGVKASFTVAKRSDGLVFISARSLSDVNVHMLMEKLGGGGHIDTAGAQLKDVSTEEAVEKVEELIMEFLKEEE
jgi:c-di-AMP phosphodiesterase-like protein